MMLAGKIALVAGATRGAGRGIAVELGAAGAMVYVTGRSAQGRPSDYGRPETIEETAALVTAAGGRAVVAFAADPDRARWNGPSLSSSGLARITGFTDLAGSRPDAWRYPAEVQEAGRPADATGYR